MVPYVIPPGTTLRSALFDLLPKEHADRVPPSAKTPRYRCVLKVRGDGGGTFTIAVDGQAVTVSEAEAAERQLWMVTDFATVHFLLDDATGRRSLVPQQVPWTPAAQIPTDPRVVARLLTMNGRLVMAVTGVPHAPARLWVAIGCGPKALRYVDESEPDSIVEVPYDVVREMRGGTLDVHTASESGQVKITGSRVLAMQFTLAMSLLSPPRR